MQAKKRLNFYECIKPVHKLSRVFGVSSFTVQVDSNGKIEKIGAGIFNIIWFVSSIALNLMLIYFARKSKRSTQNKIEFLSAEFLWCFELFMCLSSITLSMCNQNRFRKILEDFIEFDKRVNFYSDELL